MRGERNEKPVSAMAYSSICCGVFQYLLWVYSSICYKGIPGIGKGGFQILE